MKSLHPWFYGKILWQSWLWYYIISVLLITFYLLIILTVHMSSWPCILIACNRSILYLHMTFGKEFIACLEYLSCSISLWCMVEVVEVWSKNILHQFIGGQTNFGMPRGAEVSLEPSWTEISWNLNSTSRRAPQVKKKICGSICKTIIE